MKIGLSPIQTYKGTLNLLVLIFFLLVGELVSSTKEKCISSLAGFWLSNIWGIFQWMKRNESSVLKDNAEA